VSPDFEPFNSRHGDRSELGLRHLQSRYVIPYVACVAAAVMVTGLFIAVRSRSAMFDRVKTEQSVTARATAQAIGVFGEAAAKYVQSIARSSLSKGSDLQVVQLLLKSEVELAAPATSLFLFSNNSQTLASTPGDGKVASILLSDSCYNRARNGDPLCFTGVFRLDSGKRRVFVFAPVYSGGGVKRVLAGGINLEDKGFQSIIMGLNPGKKGFSYLVDKKGRLIVSGDPDKENEVGDVSKFSVVKSVLGGEMGSTVYRYGRAKMIAAFYPVDPMGWGLVVQRPYGEAFQGVGGLYAMVFIFLLLAGGAAAALGTMQTQAITRFLFTIGGRMDAIARGHINQEISREESGGFAPLVSAFNRMVESLRVEKKEGARTLDDVRQIARFNQGILASIQDLFVVVDNWHAVVMCNEKAEAFMPPEMRPCAGKGLGLLGPAWGQRRIADAARKAIESMQEISLTGVRFTGADGSAAIYDFRIYPLTTDPGGAVLYGREVSEMVNKHEKVIDSERFFREIATDVGDPIVLLDKQNKIEWINTAAGRLLAADGETIGSSWNSRVSERYRGVFIAALAELDGAGATEVEAEIICGDKKQLVEIIAARTEFGSGETKTALSFRKVDARRLAERAALAEKPNLEKRIKFLSSIIESLPDELAVVGEKGQVLLVNSAFARLFNEQKEVFVGKRFDTLCAAGAPIDVAELDPRGVVRREMTLKNLRGKTFQAEVHAAALKNSNGHKSYVFSIREIGAEREAHARECRMLEARTRTRMARTVAERFEIILENLNAEIKELGASIFAPETRAIWERAVKQYKDLALASNSLMMYSMDAPVQLTHCSIESIIKETIATLGRKGMLPPNVEIVTHIGRDCPKLNADDTLLQMAVWHLVLNAVQAAAHNTEGGEAVVRAMYAEIEGRPSVLVETVDNGPDYNPKEIDRMFEPFYGTKPGGMGLGLTLARRAVIKHNGLIGIDRIKGVTRAGFSIPLDLTPAAIRHA
jgi:PAS domain S-box-containing protein